MPGQEDITGRDSGMPAFSPTGTMIAFAGDILLAGGVVPNWEIDFDLSNLYVADVDPVGRLVSNVRQLVPGNGRALYFPSFNPSGALVAELGKTKTRSSAPLPFTTASRATTASRSSTPAATFAVGCT